MIDDLFSRIIQESHDDASPDALGDAATRAFADLHRVACGLDDYPGSTCSLIMINETTGLVTCASLGDSLGVMCTISRTRRLTGNQSEICGVLTRGLTANDRLEDNEAERQPGELRGVRCAVQARAASCARGEAAMCGAPVFVTSSSFRVLRFASRLLGADARYADNPDFVSHGGLRNGYLTPLLEMAVLSASRVIVGSAASSYPLEAANFAGTTAIIRDFGMYPTIAKALRQVCAPVIIPVSGGVHG